MAAIVVALMSGVNLLLALPRLLLGPSQIDRVFALNGLIMGVSTLVAGTAVAARRADLLDVVIAGLLAAVVLNAAILKAFVARSFQPAFAPSGEGAP